MKTVVKKQCGVETLILLLSSEGKESAKSYDAKYIETSCVLKHNVDELLVGVTKQILLRKKESSMGSNSRAGTQSRVKIILIQYIDS